VAEARELLELKQRLALVETRLQQLFEHLDLRPREAVGGESGGWGGSGGGDDPLDPNSDPEIQDLLAKGNEIQAIKRYSELTGLGLKEAKEAIEEYEG
jgi:large subunit ribosomal protein L7/L12